MNISDAPRSPTFGRRTDNQEDNAIAELRDDNQRMVDRLKAMKDVAGAGGENASDSLIDDWTDMAEERVWFLTVPLG